MLHTEFFDAACFEIQFKIHFFILSKKNKQTVRIISLKNSKLFQIHPQVEEKNPDRVEWF